MLELGRYFNRSAKFVNNMNFRNIAKHMKGLLAAGWKGRVTLAWKGNLASN